MEMSDVFTTKDNSSMLSGIASNIAQYLKV